MSPSKKSKSRSPTRRSASRSAGSKSPKRSPKYSPKRSASKKKSGLRTYYVFRPNTYEVVHSFRNRAPRDAAIKAACRGMKNIVVFDPNRTRNKLRTIHVYKGSKAKIDLSNKDDDQIAFYKERGITEEGVVSKIETQHLTDAQYKMIVRPF